jgi:putative aldouronate transport system substrate-binding protein
MEKRFKKASLLLVILIVVSIIAACATSPQTTTGGTTTTTASTTTASTATAPTTQATTRPQFPIVDDAITLTIFVSRTAAQPSYSEMYFFQEYEKLSNIKIDWMEVPQENLTERKNIILATGDLPDAFMKSGINQGDLYRYGAQGSFLALNDLIAQFAPQLSSVLDDKENYSGVKEALTHVDGNIYGFPYVAKSDFFSVRMDGGLFINRVWLNNVGLDMPKTTDDFVAMLSKFKTDDPNKNGEQDEIPWMPLGINQAVKTLMGSWGLGNRGTRHQFVDYDEASGKLRFIPTTDRYKELLQYINNLYQNKLIDEDVFTNGAPEFIAKAGQNILGVQTIVTNVYAGDYKNDFEGCFPLVGPYGDQIWHPAHTPILSPGSLVITSSNKYPEETTQWVDYLYSDAGMELFFLGKKDESYVQNADGSYSFTELITKNPDGKTIAEILSRYSPYAGGDNPALLSNKYFIHSNDPVLKTAAERLFTYPPTEIWGSFNYTSEEAEKMNAIGTDVIAFTQEKTAEFISGRTSFDAWDDYVATFSKMRIDDYLDFYEIGYNRYVGK